jgi:hypothetical protein
MWTKQWRNGPGGRWTARIQWYEMAQGKGYKLVCRDAYGKANFDYTFFLSTREEADMLWEFFKSESATGEGFLEAMVETLQAIGD